MYETIFLWQKCVERSLLCTTWHALCVNESRAFCGTKTVHHNISSSTHCLVAFRQSTTFVHTKHGCERGIYYRSHNPTKSIPLWLWPSMPVMSFSCLTGLQRCCHNCKRSKRDEEARVTETGARKKKIQTHAPLTLHYTHGHASCPASLFPVSFCTRNTGRSGSRRKANPEHRPDNGLHRKLPHGSQSLLWVPLRPGGTLARSSPKQRTEIPADVSSAQERSGFPSRESRNRQTTN